MRSLTIAVLAIAATTFAGTSFADEAPPPPADPKPSEAKPGEAKPCTPCAEEKKEVSKASAVAGDTHNRFGEKGTFVIHVTAGPMLGGLVSGAMPTLGIESRTEKQGDVESKSTTFYVNPRMHYFLVHNVSLGAELLYASNSGLGLSAIGIMPKLGFDLLFGEHVSIWPQIGLGWRRVNADTMANPQGWIFADLDLPLLVHPVSNLAIGVGPAFTFTLWQSGDHTTTSFRWLNAHVIGWF